MKSQTESLKFSIKKTVMVDGIVLPPGTYRGRRVRIGVAAPGQTLSLKWEYRLDTDQFANLQCDTQVSDGSIKVL